MENPFKFGTIVEEEYFTDRVQDNYILLGSQESMMTGEYPTSTLYSALKRLQKEGYVIYADSYELEDPFFKEWILKEMHS